MLKETLPSFETLLSDISQRREDGEPKTSAENTEQYADEMDAVSYAAHNAEAMVFNTRNLDMRLQK